MDHEDSTPNVWLPATLVGVTVVAALAAGGAFAVLRKKKVPPDCSGVGKLGGTLDGISYIEDVTGGADPNDELPMLIVFHSLGGTPKGAASFRSIPGIRVIRPQGPFEKGNGYSWVTEPARGNQEKLAESMRLLLEMLVPFVRDIQRCRPTLGKPVVTGSSQGGHMAYLLATEAPDEVQGAVAVAGWLPESLWNKGMAPTVGIHGTQDKTVPFERTEEFAQVMGFPFYGYEAGHEVTGAMGKKWRQAVRDFLLRSNA